VERRHDGGGHTVWGTTQESIVKEIATPRGWYRTYDRFVSGDAVSKELQATLGQNFDVVHCMSGGFLNLALVLSSKIPAKFKVLVLDSTPIMPQPKAFVRFARAYMSDHGLDLITKLLPERFHTWIYTSRWGVGGAYVRAKHKVKLQPVIVHSHLRLHHCLARPASTHLFHTLACPVCCPRPHERERLAS